ncbi:branched-chain-amino-acid transaminase [Thiomicrorhabdus sp.]|uniref:branched-chain-amino-acid transaminase n=1 Tax=Thiomicrorhabdus sp. TaxID=2039724 RepID=UPI0029C89F0B|nr:branched-chain-amino-acid transaminase [Thiomicrorhabdus sp.]
MQEYCWLNGEIIPVGEAKVSVLDHGVLYGDGVFEGMRVYNRRTFKLAEHLERLQQSAHALQLEMPYSIADLTQACEQLINTNGMHDGYIRLVVTRGEGFLGLDPRNCNQPNVFILYRGLKMGHDEIQQRGARLITASVRRTPMDVLEPKIKTLNYLNNILAKMEANQAGADDAILLNHAGQVAEASAANLFIVKNGILLTPPLEAGILQGITRDTIIELAQKNGLTAAEQPMSLYDVYNADEGFLTGSGAELVPIGEVNGRKLKQAVGPVFQQLVQAYHRLTRGETE